MNYEKAYKEALKRAKSIHNEHRAQCHDVMVKVFPELAESEDERIRKEIINVVKQFDEGTTICGENYDYNKWIAWLKKQGETKQVTDFSDLKTWKLIVDAVLTKEHGIGQYLDSGITETYAKELLERFGNIKQRYVL